MMIETGQVFGKLTVIELLADYHCLCKCNCGNYKRIYQSSLQSGRSKSCGCGQGRRSHQNSYKSIEYKSYSKMIKRCYSTEYNKYQHEGISVCDRWRFGESGVSGFDCFVNDMGHKPTPKHEIDRFPDNKGNYEPSNCRWASHTENNRNRTNNHLITAFGETKTIQDWAEDARCVVSANTLLYRVRDTAYPPELLITISAYTNSREFKRALAEFGSQCLAGRK
jgi:hypothetical protein